MKHILVFILLFMFTNIYIFPKAEAKRLIPAPLILTDSSAEKPLSFSPVLHWQNTANFVSCELEVFTALPDKLNDKKISNAAAFRTQNIYSSYYNLPLYSLLTDTADNEIYSLWWRVRFLDRNKKPISRFCKPNHLFVSKKVPPMDSPVPLAPIDDKNNLHLLYPVYLWISPFGTDTCEIELYDSLPSDNTKQPIWRGTSSYQERYDDFPRLQKGSFYWRVRAFDANGTPKGNWSDFVSFSNVPHHVRVAVFGDSISHGGGHLSFGPNSPELSWLNWLNFSAVNLSQSGDLTQDMVNRFESDVLPFSPEILLILGGTNDIRGHTPVEDTIKHLDIIKEKCLQNHIRPIFLTLPPIYPENIKLTYNENACNDWKIKLNKCNSFIRSMPEFIDVNLAFQPYTNRDHLKNEYALDGLHPDENGKKIIADTVNDYWKRKHIL